MSSNPRTRNPTPPRHSPHFLGDLGALAVHPNQSRREGTTVDSIISIALSSQVTAWKVRDTFEQRASRGKTEDLAEILASVPDAPPAPGDERE